MRSATITLWKRTVRSAFVSCALFLLTAPLAFAVDVEQVNSDLNEEASLPDVVGGIINVFLGLLGIIALVLIIYAGYLWMTAAGNEEKIDQAKKILRNALVGLVIILLSAAIVNFILSRLFEETGADATTTTTTGCAGCAIPGTASSDFYVLSTNPEQGAVDVALCTDVTVRLSEFVDQSTVTPETWFLQVQNGAQSGASCTQNNQCASGVCSEGLCQGDALAGEIGFGPGDDSKYFNFIPNADLEANTTYTATVVGGADGILSQDPNPDDGIEERLAMISDYTFSFTTGTTTDDIPPQVKENGSSPFPADEDTDVCTNTVINYDFTEPMRITSFNDDTSFVLDSAVEGVPDWVEPLALRGWSFGGDFDYVQVRPDEQLADNTEYGVRLYGGDLDNNFENALTDSCGNPLDGDADGLPEGNTADNYFGFDPENGETDDPLTWTTGENAECTPFIESVTTTASPYYGEYAGARGGAACSENSECASGVCSEGTCEGFGGTSVKITGNYLGPHPEVEFAGSTLWAGDGFNSCFDEQHFGNIADDTSRGDMCLDEEVQTITQINTRIPIGATDSNVRVSVADETSEAATDSVDPLSPRITGMSPNDGAVGQYITLAGEHFGTRVGTVVLRSLDGTRESTLAQPEACGETWANDEVVAIAPEQWTNPNDGTTGEWQVGESAYMQVISSDGKYSDAELFTFSDTVRPNLCAIEPRCDAAAGNPFTVTGERFGSSQGDNQVIFTSSANSDQGYIGAMATWSDTQASGTTDAAMPQDGYWVSVFDSETGENSNARKYSIPCSDGPSVVSLSTCDATNGYYPAPNPRPDTTDACVNTMIGVLFDQELAQSSINGSSVFVQQYNTGNELNESYTPLSVIGNFGASGGRGGTKEWSVVDGDTTYSGFQFDVDATSIDTNQDGIADGVSSSLQPNTWYQVTVTDAITNTDGVGMNDTYTYRFKTRNNTDFCEADSVNVAPSSATVNDYMTDAGDVENQLYVASQYTTECSLLDGAGSWTWAIADLAIGGFGSSGPSSNNKSRVYAVGDDEENTGTTDVSADLSGVSDTAKFSVDLGFCTNDDDCASCSNDTTTSTCNVDTNRCEPIIQSIAPASGDNGSWVTVNGCMFGSKKGAGYFTAGDQRVTTEWPDEAMCGDTWTNDQVILQVPGEDTLTTNGEYTIEIETQYGDVAQSSDLYTLNDEVRIGACRIDPDSAKEESKVSAYGQNFGETAGLSAFRGDDDYDGNSDTVVTADPAQTTWANTQIDTRVPEGAVTDEDNGYRVVANGGSESCTSPSECSNPLGFEVSCKKDGDCGSGCCSGAGVCQPAEYCSACEEDVDCLGGAGQACEGSVCQNGQCTPTITALSPASGPAQGPVTVQGCYFGSYDPAVSGVTFTSQDGIATTAQLLCSDGWSNKQIIVEVPNGEVLPEGTEASVTVTTKKNGTTATAASFAVSGQCSSGAVIPTDGVPLLCDLDPVSGTAASADGSREGEEIDFEGDHYTEEGTKNVFADSGGGSAGNAFTFVDATESSAQVPNGASSGDAWVEVAECSGNGIAFEVECTSASDCASGEYCVGGSCAESRCGCTPSDASSESAQCGSGNGCSYDTTESQYCCSQRPTFEESNPKNGATDICPNALFELTFSEEMQYSSTDSLMLYKVNDDGELGDPVSATVTTTGELMEVLPDSALDVNTTYRLVISSDTDSDTGVVSKSTGMALEDGKETIEFTTAADMCVPDSVVITNSEGDSDAHTFTSAGATDSMTASVYASDGTAIQPSDEVGWNFSWSPYQDEEASCDDVAWVQLDDEEEDTTTSDATSEMQVIESGTESDAQTSIEVTVTQTDGSTWQDDRGGSAIEDDLTVSTFFCEPDLIREYIDSSDSDSFVSHTFPQHFAVRYCQNEESTLPEIGDPVVIETAEDDGKFLEYLFLDQNDKEKAFAIWVYSNDEKLTARQWYEENVPSPDGSVSDVTIDGYAGIKDGTSYYIAASNIDGSNLYTNIYFISFNDDEVSEELADEIMSNFKFNFDNVSYAECEGSDAQKLRRDTQRVTDLHTTAALASDYYDANTEYPLPESGSLGSYIKGMTTSAWPSWSALGNQLGQSLGSDPWNFFDAQEAATPWDNQSLSQPWVYTGDDATLADSDCERDEASGYYFDQDGGTCYDDVNKTFYCPANSHVYIYRRSVDDGDDAGLYAHLEYESDETEEYRTAATVFDACSGSAECNCVNYGIEGNPKESSWEEVSS